MAKIYSDSDRNIVNKNHRKRIQMANVAAYPEEILHSIEPCNSVDETKFFQFTLLCNRNHLFLAFVLFQIPNEYIQTRFDCWRWAFFSQLTLLCRCRRTLLWRCANGSFSLFHLYFIFIFIFFSIQKIPFITPHIHSILAAINASNTQLY